MKFLKTVINSYKNNFWFILVSSFMFLFSFMILFLSPTKTYLSLGSVNVRVLSVPQFSLFDLLFLIFVYAVSLFLFSDAVTNLNLIVKSKRTLTKIPTQILNGIFEYSWKIFFIYTFVFLLITFINLFTFSLPFHSLFYPISMFILFLLVFFVPPAIVIDNYSIGRAMEASIKMVKKKLVPLLLLSFFSFLFLFLSEFILFFIVPVSISKYILILINSFIILPIFTIIQTEFYMEKYPLSP